MAGMPTPDNLIVSNGTPYFVPGRDRSVRTPRFPWRQQRLTLPIHLLPSLPSLPTSRAWQPPGRSHSGPT